ncbi:MAG: hypothetical protein HC822_03480 [Oscillochloris sp.]|nr:hypothetical protein [Oscillochloris sp.]
MLTIKNWAYAWRQMIFFLALLPDAQVTAFTDWAEAELCSRPQAFQDRFQPAYDGLIYVAAGYALARQSALLEKLDRRPRWRGCRSFSKASPNDPTT